MSDKEMNTPNTEVKEVKEGSVEAEIAKEGSEVAPQDKKHEPETVPLAAYLELKNDLKALQKDIKEAKGSSKEKVEIRGVRDLSQKYPDVSEEFIQDILSSATTEATKKIEEKYNPIIEKQEQEKRQAAFDKAFDNLFTKALNENPDLPKNIDKDLVKELALTPKYKNVPVADIVVKMYGTAPAGKPSSENEVRSSSDRVEEVADFAKITPDQKKLVMNDPKVRQKYFDWLDSQPGR